MLWPLDGNGPLSSERIAEPTDSPQTAFLAESDNCDGGGYTSALICNPARCLVMSAQSSSTALLAVDPSTLGCPCEVGRPLQLRLQQRHIQRGDRFLRHRRRGVFAPAHKVFFWLLQRPLTHVASLFSSRPMHRRVTAMLMCRSPSGSKRCCEVNFRVGAVPNSGRNRQRRATAVLPSDQTVAI